jgi:hypothetical protein
MATRRIPMLAWPTIPDASGDVWIEPYPLSATNDVWGALVVRFKDTATRIGLHGRIVVPKNYIGTPKVVIRWTSQVTAGNVVWDVDYRAVGPDNVESLDQATAQQSVTVTDAAPGATDRLLETSVALTAANLAVDDALEFILFRDGTDGADTMVGDAILTDLLLEYVDA